MHEQLHTKRTTFLAQVSQLRNRLRREGSSYSTVTTLFALMFAVSLLLDSFNPHRSQSSVNLISAGIVASLVLALLSIVKGKDLPRWAGLTLMIAHTLVTALIIGFSTTSQSVTTNLQEMPLIAFYLAWFYRKPVARICLYGGLTLIVGLGLLGPGSYLDTDYRLHEVIRLVLFMSLSLEIGFLWRGSSATDSNIDDLTGAHTRKELNRDLERELKRNARYGRSFTVVVVDLDNFKSINDSRGHHAGDQALVEVVANLAQGTRCTDSIYRYGGDEFVLLLPDTRESDAYTLLNRLHKDAPHPWSWGTAEATPHDSVGTLLARADAMMFEHKNLTR